MKGNKNPSGGSSTESVKVVVRCRPMNKKEQEKGNFLFIAFNLFFPSQTEILKELLYRLFENSGR